MSAPGATDEHPSTEVSAAIIRPRQGPTVRQFVVNVVEGPSAGATWRSAGTTCAIGSESSNDLALQDPTVSRYHCELTWTPDGPRIRDLDSRNGTVLDGVRVVDACPRSGSLIRLGDSVVRFEPGDSDTILPVAAAERFGHLVGRSVAMRMVFALLERAAASTSTVLVEGETGTGKEATVRSLHEASARRDGPYIIVDCGAIPSHLLESELFGHERGAFTGATDRRIGAFEAADGGTIFLDEIGELPLDLQPKLLRALESRQVRRVGSAQHREVNFRVVAATNRDLRQEVNAGRFRADLYYRLGVVRIRIPPLRERPEDIPLLAQHILDRVDAPDEDKAPFHAPEFMARLASAAWIGNVRELRNYIEQCVVLRQGLAVEDSGELAAVAGAAEARPRVDVGKPYAEERRRALDGFEAAYVEGVLRANGDNVSRAARAAGLGRVYFYELLRKHNIR